MWLFRMTANPAWLSASTTASYTWSGVLPRSCGLAVTAASGTGVVRCTSSLEKGSRMVLTPNSRKSESSRAIGIRSRPRGMSCAFWPA